MVPQNRGQDGRRDYRVAPITDLRAPAISAERNHPQDLPLQYEECPTNSPRTLRPFGSLRSVGMPGLTACVLVHFRGLAARLAVVRRSLPLPVQLQVLIFRAP